jgi:hypothetical protein
MDERSELPPERAQQPIGPRVSTCEVKAHAGKRRVAGHILSALLLALAAGGCRRGTSSPTGIVLELDSEYAIPTEINDLSVTVTGLTGSADGGDKTALDQTFHLGTGQYELPGRLALLPAGNGDGRVHVIVRGQLNEVTVVERSATLSFYPEHWVLLTLTLRKVCHEVTCQAGDTCLDGSCGSDMVTASTLPTYVSAALPMMTDAGGSTGPKIDGQADATAESIDVEVARTPAEGGADHAGEVEQRDGGDDGADDDGRKETGVCSNGATGTCGAELGAKGACAGGNTTCASGTWGPCTVGAKVTDTCDLGNDDDCDGIPNEKCACINGATDTCGTELGAKGACAAGSTACAGGAWGPCSRAAKSADACVFGNDDMCTGFPVGSPGNTQCQCGGFPAPNAASTGLPHLASYANNSDGTVTDTVTGLTWEAVVDPGSYTATKAATYCAGKSPVGDWRLPTVVELASLVDVTIASPGPTINQTYFPNTPSDSFWTSMPFGSVYSSWCVSFIDGLTAYNDVGVSSRVRCVRVSAPTCYPTRYQAQAGGLVHDEATGLTWQQTIDAGSYIVSEATTYCASLGAGWRLPSLTELQSIVDYTKSDPAIDEDAFPNTPSDPSSFWTSSPAAGAPGGEWSVRFDFGAASYSPSTYTFMARCVR